MFLLHRIANSVKLRLFHNQLKVPKKYILFKRYRAMCLLSNKLLPLKMYNHIIVI